MSSKADGTSSTQYDLTRHQLISMSYTQTARSVLTESVITSPNLQSKKDGVVATNTLDNYDVVGE